MNDIERYWEEHTVNSTPFTSKEESERYLLWRSDIYPKMKELMDLYGDRGGQTVLDYGCGPGDDTIGYLMEGGASKVFSLDISSKALGLLEDRLKLYGIDSKRVELIKIQEGESIPIDVGSIDHVHSSGVIHHSSSPADVLKELYRVLRPSGTGVVMVYNRESVWFHLFTVYERMIKKGHFEGLSPEEAFSRTTDGENCPVSKPFVPKEFISLCRNVGFDAEFAGGYISEREMEMLRYKYMDALKDERLPEESREFLDSLQFSGRGFPMKDKLFAGIGGVYRLRK
ncbi:class I SAM-dependent methyltransferase [Limisalsivibrio acetivorans]|uniref:class I SAM-dependent methyltransferase n=1 Tax=Limisalsivibrio acetivorans TaxID=1304888 RepID=UPI0003B5FDF1|nr:class I SAM-dependent methyltransferase [Limisalsivibrio acetivorans]